MSHGAWAVGMIFHPESPRACDPEAAVEIGAALKRRSEIVGVFVNAHLDEVVELAEGTGLTMLQLHGEEGPSYCAEAARRSGLKVIKAVRVREDGLRPRASRLPNRLPHARRPRASAVRGNR